MIAASTTANVAVMAKMASRVLKVTFTAMVMEKATASEKAMAEMKDNSISNG